MPLSNYVSRAVEIEYSLLPSEIEMMSARQLCE